MYIGIDIGGTNTAAALVDNGGTIIKKASVPTDAKNGPEAVTKGILSVCRMLTDGMDVTIKSVGIGVPGLADSKTGRVVFTPNLPLDGVDITDAVRGLYNAPVFVENDANCAALGEFRSGALAGAENAVLVTLGTGIGGGIILNGQLYKGHYSAAGELGHMVICIDGRACGCGRRGCWETYASATGLCQTARECMEAHKDSVMYYLCGGDPAALDGRIPFAAMQLGDSAGRIAVDIYIKHLAAGLVNIINIFQPYIICIGGGVSDAGEELLEPLRTAVNAEKYARHSLLADTPRIVNAALGNDAGVIGAAWLAADQLRAGRN